MRKNRSAFSNYNMVRMREALRYFSPEKLRLFLKIPFYLHINSGRYPGFVNSRTQAYGIWRFEQSGFYREAALNNLFPKSIIETCRVKKPAILGLYHIGSLGTFTQSEGSDFDFWVMIDKKKFSRARYEDLEKKLDAIVSHCRDACDQKVSFFIMDQKEIQTNHYLPFQGEETLVAPKLFLKEEFYRTFLMIAGKIPLWAVLPFQLQQDSSMKTQALIRQILADNDDLIDLGLIRSIPLADILKGLLWHICKSKSDPVKALIKATMIFSVGFSRHGSSRLLCDQIRQGYSKAGIDDYRVDPYKALFDRILKFHETEDPAGVNLIKNAVFYRLCGYPQVKIPGVNSPKRLLLDTYIRKWKLNKSQVKKLLSYKDWSESEKLVLERSFVSRLTQMVEYARKKIGKIDHSIDESEKRNWTLLTNKTKERLNRANHKIEACSCFLKRQHFTRLTIAHGSSGFTLDLQTREGEEISRIHRHPKLLGLFGWVLENQLYRRQQAEFKFNSPLHLFESTSTPISPDHLYLKFVPLKPLSDDLFEKEAAWSKMVVMLYYDEQTLTAGEFLISNSWGEYYLDEAVFKGDEPIQDKCRKLVRKMKMYSDEGTRIYICQLATMHDPKIVYRIKKAYTDNESPNHALTMRKKPYLDRL